MRVPFPLLLSIFSVYQTIKAQKPIEPTHPLSTCISDSTLSSFGSEGQKIVQYRQAQQCIAQYDAKVDSLRDWIRKSSFSRSKKRDYCTLIALTTNSVSQDVFAKVREMKNRKALALHRYIPLSTLYAWDREYKRNLETIKQTEAFAEEVSKYAVPDPPKAQVPLEISLYGLERRDTLADIGAGGGALERALSTYCDKLTVYTNEIDPVLCSSLQTKLAFLEVLDQKDISFKTQLGNDTSTLLPSHTFDKLIVKNAFHHFSCPVEMLGDFKRVLKREGKLFIVDVLREEAGETPACALYMPREVLLRYLADSGFALVKEEPLDYMHYRLFEFQLGNRLGFD